MIRILYPIGILSAAAFSCFACYTSIFWAWVTATPLAEGQLERARYNAYAWFAGFVVSWAAIFLLLYFWRRRCRIEDERHPPV